MNEEREATSQALRALEKAHLAAQRYREEHEAVLAGWEASQAEVAKLTDDLKLAARRDVQLCTLIGGTMEVEVRRPIKRWIDPVALLAALPHAVRVPGIIKAIDSDVVDQQVDLGAFDKEVVDTCRREEPQTPAVTIRPLRKGTPKKGGLALHPPTT